MSHEQYKCNENIFLKSPVGKGRDSFSVQKPAGPDKCNLPTDLLLVKVSCSNSFCTVGSHQSRIQNCIPVSTCTTCLPVLIAIQPFISNFPHILYCVKSFGRDQNLLSYGWAEDLAVEGQLKFPLGQHDKLICAVCEVWPNTTRGVNEYPKTEASSCPVALKNGFRILYGNQDLANSAMGTYAMGVIQQGAYGFALRDSCAGLDFAERSCTLG